MLGQEMQSENELAPLRRFLQALESCSMKITEGGIDVTKREIAKLKPEIEFLEFSARVRGWTSA
jgi:hypothetical protein